MNTFLIGLYVIGFMMGVGSVPAAAYLVRGGLPAMFVEPLANVLLTATMFGAGSSTLHHTDTDEYELQRASSDLEPKRNWSRFYGVPFGLTYERDEDAFGDLTANVEPEMLEPEEKFGSKKAAEVDIVRNGEPSFVDVSEDTRDAILIKVGETLAQLRNSAGLELANTAHRKALQEHGGDTSDYGAKFMLIGMFLFSAMGLGMGWVVFF